MHLLLELAGTPQGQSLGRLSERLQLPKTTVFSMLRALESGGFVESANGYHRLGQAAFSMATAICQQNNITSRVRPVLHWLQQQSGETVMFGVPAADASCMVLTEVVEAENSLRFTAHVGAQRKLYSTSVGLSWLAHATPQQQAHYLASVDLVRHTPTTVTSRTALKALLQRIREQGFVLNSGSVLGASAVGVPVFDTTGFAAASFSVAGPSARIEQRAREITRLAHEAGRQMSRLLGYTAAYPKQA